MPRGTDGRCFCGALAIDPTGELAYANGFCIPFPIDEGLRYNDCKMGHNQGFGGKCDYFCLCRNKKDTNGDIQCCKPRREQALQDGIIMEAPETTVTSTSGPPSLIGRRITTITTTSEPYYGAQKISGVVEMSTVIPWQTEVIKFLNDDEVNSGVVVGIAMKLAIPKDWVSAVLSIPSKHIQVDYQISVPADTWGNRSAIALWHAISDSNDEEGRADWSLTLGLGISYETKQEYSVSVHNILTPATARLSGRTSSARSARGQFAFLQAFSLAAISFLLASFQPSGTG
jgi:hypothetical protein